jgi:hypothetical protein
MPAHVVWILVLAFWTPGKDAPTKLEAHAYATDEICQAAATTLDAAWEAKVHGGSTSWACFGAYQAPTT